MKRAGPAGLIARRLVELELQQPREEIAGVGRVAGDVEFRARIESRRRSRRGRDDALVLEAQVVPCRSEEHTSELQSLMRISYAVFCLKKKTNTQEIKTE